MARTLVVEDGVDRREVLLAGTVSIGRDPGCDITHGDPRLSRRHAEVRVTADGIVVSDLESRNGIRVNGRPAREVTLRAGDVLEAGPLRIRLVDEDGGPPTGRMAIPAPPDDDRTRVVPRRGPRQADALRINPELDDDRTRMIPPAQVPLPSTALDLRELIDQAGGLGAEAPDATGTGIAIVPRRPPSPRGAVFGGLLCATVSIVTIAVITTVRAGTVPLAWEAGTLVAASAAAGAIGGARIARAAADASRWDGER